MLKPIKENTVQIRRKFDQTFKREAVQNWLAIGKSAEVIAKESGILQRPNKITGANSRYAIQFDLD